MSIGGSPKLTQTNEQATKRHNSSSNNNQTARPKVCQTRDSHKRLEEMVKPSQPGPRWLALGRPFEIICAGISRKLTGLRLAKRQQSMSSELRAMSYELDYFWLAQT